MTGPDSVHVSVMLDEVIRWIEPCPGKLIVDGTLGGGGHARAMAELVKPTGSVIGLDRDPAAVEAAERTLADLPIRPVNANFCDLREVLEQLDVPSIDGALLDLGLSSDQLADTERGFSFSSTGSLDLRFDTTRGEPASRLINRLGEKHLADLIYAYGEERHSRRIARRIVAQRRDRPIETAAELAELVRRSIPRARGRQQIDPATRTFQALRIAVNEELKSLEIALRRLPECLAPGGCLVVISFHSLEDRRVKEAFRDDERYEVLTKKPVRPSADEVTRNPRARSAKLRAARRV